MDLSWIEQLPQPIKIILLGASGNFLGGMGADVSKRLLGVVGQRVKKRLQVEPQNKVLNVAFANALYLTAKNSAIDNDQIFHFLKIFGAWLEREDVVDELSQLIDPRRDTIIDMELLKKEFDDLGYAAEWLKKGISFSEVVALFVRYFYDCAAKQPELQGQIQISILRDITERTEQLIKESIKQSKSLKRLEDRLAPDMKGRWRNYNMRLAGKCKYLPLRGVDFKSADATAFVDQRMGLADVYVQLDTTAKIETKGKKESGYVLSDQSVEELKPLSALDALSAKSRIILLGDPGSGKTTFISHLCLCLALHNLEPENDWLKHLQNWPENWSSLVPIPVELRQMASWMEAQPSKEFKSGLFMAYLKNWLKQLALENLYDYLLDILHKGNALLLLDGLDEVPLGEDLHSKVRKIISDLPKAFPEAPMLVTCRILSYQTKQWQLDSKNWSKYELANLSREKIKHFIKAWYYQLAVKGAISNFKIPSEKLIHAVRLPDLLRLARNPLLLTVMALVHTHKGELPDARSLLYEDVVDLLLWRWEAIKLESVDKQKTSWRQLLHDVNLKDIDLKRTLWEIAYEVHGNVQETESGDAIADIPESTLHSALRELHPERSLDWADKMVEIIKLRAGLLVESQPGRYSFPHRTFEEYLACCHLSNLPEFIDRAKIMAQKGFFWWEVILLAVGRLVHHGGDIDRPLMLLSELCPADKPEQEDINWCQNIWLAGKCLLEIGIDRAERRSLGKKLVGQVRQHSTTLLTHGLLKPRERAEVGDILGVLGDQRPGVDLKDGLPDIDWVSIKHGPFLMGSDERKYPYAKEREKPQFLCSLIRKDFRVSRFPVTIAQYHTFIEDKGYENQRFWTSGGWKWNIERNIAGPKVFSEISQSPNHPQIGVSWFEAVAFCRWLSEKLEYQICLPTEAEWERASRGTKGLRYPWGDAFDPINCNMKDTGIDKTSTVGIFAFDNMTDQVSDLSGNVWEWCLTKWFDTYWSYEVSIYYEDKLDASHERVVRGGAFHSDGDAVRSAFRYKSNPQNRSKFIGFRVVSPSSEL